MSDPLNGEDLFRRLPVPLYRTTRDGTVVAANQETADLLGYDSPEDLMREEGLAEAAHVDARQRQVWQENIERRGVARDFLILLRRTDGSTIWVRDTARAVYGSDGEFLFYEGVLTDVTGEIRASVSSSILSGVLESTTDNVVVFDEGGRLRYANSAARQFLGISEAEMLTRPPFQQVLPSHDWAKLATVLTEGSWSGEVNVVDHLGEPHPLWAVMTIHETVDQRYLAVIARDLTHLKRTQRRLEELVMAKDVFVATVSHELRNPLAGVMGLAEELRDRFGDFGDQERLDLITLIAHQAAEMTSLVEDLLVAVRSDIAEVAVAPQRVEVTSHLAELTHRSPVEWMPPGQEVWAWVDPQRFRQIVRNLLSNAERHGGSRVRLELECADERVEVRVLDDGRGIAPDDVERIFEPFQRARGTEIKSGSVGLGLSVARQLARLMGGDLQYGRNGGWSTFKLTVPAAPQFEVSTS